MTTFQRRCITLYALIATPLSGACVDIYVPSLPGITQHFSTTQALVQLSISIYLLGYAVFSLLFGPIADTYGRKKPLYFGAILFIISSYLITKSSSIDLFLFYRLLQGIAIAAIASVSRAIIPAVFEGKAYRHVINMTTIAWSIGPIVAPYIGGYLEHYIGWQASFYVLTGYGAILLCCLLFLLPETLKNKSTFSPAILFSRYRLMMLSPMFVGAAMICGLVYSSIVVFNTMAPFLIQRALHLSAITYGKISLLMGFAFFLGNTVNRLLNINQEYRMLGALALMLAGVIIGLYFMVSAPMSLLHIVLPSFLIICASGIVFPCMYGSALGQFPAFAGTVSSVLTLVFVLTASLTSAICSGLKAHSQVPFILFLTVIVILISLMYRFLFIRKST